MMVSIEGGKDEMETENEKALVKGQTERQSINMSRSKRQLGQMGSYSQAVREQSCVSVDRCSSDSSETNRSRWLREGDGWDGAQGRGG